MTIYRGPLRRVVRTKDSGLAVVTDVLECGHSKPRRLDVDPIVAKRRCVECLTQPVRPLTYRCTACGYQVWVDEGAAGDRCPNPHIHTGCAGMLGEDENPEAPGYLARAGGGRYG